MIPFLKRSLLVVFGMAMSFNASAQTEEMDLSGTWGFQADFMDFRTKVASLDYRYLHRLQDKIELPGITDDYQIGWKCPYRHIDRLTRKYEYMYLPGINVKLIFRKNGKESKFSCTLNVHIGLVLYIYVKPTSPISVEKLPAKRTTSACHTTMTSPST